MAEERIVLAHGGGGALTRELIDAVIAPAVGAPEALPDAADVPGTDLVMTTDSFVVKPLFFRGGDIGSLAVHGTINDLAVSGAEPLALSLGVIVEEGIDVGLLRRVIESAAAAAREAGVGIVTGDTKVVARGEADEIFLNTAGVGRRLVNVAPPAIQPGDCVLINGPIASHGIAVLSERKGLEFETEVRSDSASVWPFVKALIDEGVAVRTMRDPTRGGLAACCVELAGDAGVSIELSERAIPVQPQVRGACDILGLDPLTVANEGKVVAFVPPEEADRALEIWRGISPDATHIGAAVKRGGVAVSLVTRHGGRRIVEMPYGEDLPRIC